MEQHAAPDLLVVVVSGPVAVGVRAALEARFGDVATRPGADGTTVVSVPAGDQAQDRAVITLLWDAGHLIRSVARRAP